TRQGVAATARPRPPDGRDPEAAEFQADARRRSDSNPVRRHERLPRQGAGEAGGRLAGPVPRVHARAAGGNAEQAGEGKETEQGPGDGTEEGDRGFSAAV